MRLLRVEPDAKFSLIVDRFVPSDVPPYAILSHRWGPGNQEVTYRDLLNGLKDGKSGFRKLQFCRDQAEKDGFEYFWVDSCCIDKSSSAEISESVNSMYKWYKGAQKCYVYFTDVSKTFSTSEIEQSTFQASKWFTRGWTLQELLAPRVVEFFSHEGHYLGDRVSLEKQINAATKISLRALRGEDLFKFSVEEKKSWSESRSTTIEEDRAYALLGIFDVNMPLIYGEGYDRAFIRLQDEIDLHYSSPRIFGYGKCTDNMMISLSLLFCAARWTQEQRKCLQLLGSSGYQDSKEQIPDRLVGTCHWFLQDSRFQTWRDGPSSTLCLAADEGCGKSVIAKSLIDFVFPKAMSCSFFFRNDAQNNANTAVCAFIHQLFLQKPSLIRHAMPEFLVIRSQLSLSFDKLWNIFSSSILDLDEIICVIDGFQACEKQSANLLLQAFESLLEKQRTSGTRHPIIRLFITRRSTNADKEYHPRVITLTDKNTSGLASDILQYIQWKLALLDFGWYDRMNEVEMEILAKEILSISRIDYFSWISVLDTIKGEGYDSKRVVFLAMENECAALIKLFLQLSISLNWGTTDGIDLSVLHVAAKKGNASIVQMLLEHGTMDIDAKDGHNQTPVFQAALHGHHEVVKLLLKGNANIELRDLGGRTPLLVASGNGHESVVGLILENGTVDINDTNAKGYTALLLACKNGQESTAKLLLQAGKADTNARDNRMNRTPLLWAVGNGHESIVKLLLRSASINTNLEDEDGMTALGLAAKLGNPVITKLLLDSKKVDTRRRSREGRSPLSWASENGHFEVVNLLLDAGPKYSWHSSSSHWDASAKPSVAVLGSLFWYGGYLHQPLWLAAENGNEAIVKRLVAFGANIDANSVLGTPLYIAAKKGHTAIVQFLVQTKANVNLRPLNDYSTNRSLQLLTSEEEGWTRKQQLLLGSRLPVEMLLLAKTHGIQYDRTGPALSAACEKGHEEIVKILLNANADVKISGPKKVQPLFLAQKHGHQSIVKLLKNHKPVAKS